MLVALIGKRHQVCLFTTRAIFASDKIHQQNSLRIFACNLFCYDKHVKLPSVSLVTTSRIQTCLYAEDYLTTH